MRQFIDFNTKWAFSKEAEAVPVNMPENWYWVNIPHCWNAIDGQDGSNDYYRGTCYYAKELNKAELPQADRYYLQFDGTNSSAVLYLNGREAARHDGGYSTWRADITELLEERNLVVVAVDNSANDRVYPQMADFTFYGGMYRAVSIIAVAESHFDLDYYGAPGIQVTPVVNGNRAEVRIQSFLTAATKEQTLRYTLLDKEGLVVAEADTSATERDITLSIPNVHLWNGRKDPYLYTAIAELSEDGTVLDRVSSRFGCRSFTIDAEKGFMLNGESYPLRGVSRHQDRWGLGNALLPEHMEEDMELICEMGANTIRLAHYQHNQYFYDLCDEHGIVVWAEIPYISRHMPTGRENTVSQMTELIVQNYNHPSIAVWGLSNEITMNGSSDPDLLENHRILNDLVHRMDPTRPTVMACVSMLDIHDEIVQIPDVLSYNHYFGWYGGNTAMNGPWFDHFHQAFPQIPIGISEYGCEGLDWHTSEPKQGDYTEEYQAYYHEELIKQIRERPYLWATHVWNMFDFGADARNEGGENGQNHKGLVTFDRKYKKDSFYAYKAWLSDEPFVHICGKRYTDRVEEITEVKVYSNLPAITLYRNGELVETKREGAPFFCFRVPNVGESRLLAVAGDCRDEAFLRKVDHFPERYRLKEKGTVLNWFDITEPEGCYSLNDSINDVMRVPEGRELLVGMMQKIAIAGQETQVSDSMMQMMDGFTVLRMCNLMAMMDVHFTKEQLLGLNAKLNQIKKPN